MKRGTFKLEPWWLALAAGGLALLAAVALRFTYRSADSAPQAKTSAVAVTKSTPLGGPASATGTTRSFATRTDARAQSRSGKALAGAVPAPVNGRAARTVRADGIVRFADPAKVGPYADRPTPGAAQFGERAEAKVSVAGRSFGLVPNQVGDFQRVYVGPKAELDVEVAYPGAGRGTPVFVEVLDGGRLADGKQAARLAVGDDQRVRFGFKTAEESGTYRVLLRVGDDEKTLDFWVGPPLAVRDWTRQQ